MFCLRQACEFETQAHAVSFLSGASYPSGGRSTCMKGVLFHPLSFGCFPNILSNCCSFLLLDPTHCLLSLSSHCVSFLQTHLCVSLSPAHSYDFGVRVAPTPSLPWIMLPCHYSVVPPARVLHVRRSGACLPAACLSGPADSLSSTTDAPGLWSRSSYGTESLENYADEQAAGSGVSCSFRAVVSISWKLKHIGVDII